LWYEYPKKKAPIYEIGAIPGKNHPCSGFGRCLKLSIRKTLCKAETSSLGGFLNLSGGRERDKMPTKKAAVKVAKKKVAAKKPASKVAKKK